MERETRAGGNTALLAAILRSRRCGPNLSWRATNACNTYPPSLLNHRAKMRSQTVLATVVALMALMICQADGLYFYLNPKETQCFYEELPADTVVVGHYMAETWDKEKHIFHINEDLGINIVVREVKEEHLVTSTLGPAEGKFAFTSHEAGDHSICLSTRLTTNEAAKLPMDDHHHQVRMHLDIIIGEAKPDNSHADRAHIRDLASRVQDLNDKLRDIRKEQQFQREREVDFRNASEKTNSRAYFGVFFKLLY